MYFGYGAPTRPPLGTAANTRRIAEKAEEVGLSYVSIADHILPPFDEKDAYPYTADGSTPWDDSGNVLECLTLATYIAGVTRKLRLVTGVMVVPLRNPLVTAKVLASIDVLSEGRLVVGCGAGWESREFEVLGAPPFARRGAAVDEYIEVFRECWTSDTPAYDGEFVQVSGFPFQPKPVQKPHPPLWIGGESPAAIRRAARLGDGWYPIINNRNHPLDTPERYAAAVDALRAACDREGHDFERLELGLVVFNYSAGVPRRGHAFTGAYDDILDDLKRYRDAGLQHAMIRLARNASLDRNPGEHGSVRRQRDGADGLVGRQSAAKGKASPRDEGVTDAVPESH